MINKENYLIYRKLAVSLMIAIFVNTISPMAAIVVDNDGSSFVTKSEFEALKTNINKQISIYEDCINTKLDDAISSYLARLNISKRTVLESKLDINGKYDDDFYLYWEASNSIAINQSHNKIAVDHVFASIGHFTDTDIWQSGRYYWNNVYDGAEQTNKLLQEVMLVTTTTDADGNTVECLKFENVENRMKANMWFTFLGSAADDNDEDHPISGWQLTNLIDLNIGDLTENKMKSNLLSYLRYVPSHSNSVWKSCFIVLKENESDTDYQVVRPFSTAYERVWIKDSDVTLGVNGSVNLPAKHGSGECYYAWSGSPLGNATHQGMDNVWTRMYQHEDYYAEWQIQTDSMQVKDRMSYNLITADNRNKANKNGVIVADTPNLDYEMTLTFNAKSNVDGKLYVYVGETPIDNWQDASSFKGKVFDFTANLIKKCEYGDIKKNQPIWILFKPNSDFERGCLGIREMVAIEK